MKLAEALLEIEKLDTQIKLLKCAIREIEEGGSTPSTSLIESLNLTHCRKREALIAVDDAEHKYRMYDLPLASFKIKAQYLKEMAEDFYLLDPNKSQEFLDEAYSILKIYYAATWLADLPM